MNRQQPEELAHRSPGNALQLLDAHWDHEPTQSDVAAEACPPKPAGRRRVTRYILSLSKGSDLFPDERDQIE
jgi:hypothetical protein